MTFRNWPKTLMFTSDTPEFSTSAPPVPHFNAAPPFTSSVKAVSWKAGLQTIQLSCLLSSQIFLFLPTISLR